MAARLSVATTRFWPSWIAIHSAERLLTGGRGGPMLPLAMALPAPGGQKIPLR